MAWREFKRGKGGKADIQRFEFSLEDNLFELYQELKNRIYQHSHYTAFNVCDPKLRRIHKAKVKDRVLHHAIFRILYSIFDNNFIFDAYSCRIEKGTHKAVGRLERFSSKLSRNNSRNIFALKCDIKKFFDSIDQEILLGLIKKKIIYADTIWLIEKIIISFPKGIPLGNVTSQLFANIYLNELDQFVKHNLKERCYLRYCDDFIILSESESHLHSLVVELDKFLQNELKLNLHPDKIIIRKYRQGIDFLGYVTLPHRRVLRTKTKKRIIKKMRNKKADLQDGVISEDSFKQGLQSYLGVLKHCEGHKIEKDIKNL